MSVLCRGKTSASSRCLRQCVSHTKSPFIQPAQSFDEAVDVPVVLHDRQKAVSSTGPVHWQDRRFPSCVATPSTNNPDDTAKVKVSQGQPDDGYLPRVRRDSPQPTRKSRSLSRRHSGRLHMTGSDHPENPEDGRGTTSCTETLQITQRSRMP